MLAVHVQEWLDLPRIVRFLPEFLTFITVIVVFVLGVQTRFRFIAAHYWLVFALMSFIVIGGTLANNVEPGPTIAGMRYYLRAIPFFFLPAVCNFTDEQVKQQFKLLLLLAFVQVPVAMYQRVALNWENHSGDSIVGTLRISSIMSVFLISTALVIVGLVASNRLSRLKGALLFLLILAPTMINETKGTVVLLPLGVFTAMMIGARPGRRLPMAAWTVVLLAGFGAMFVPVYDFMNRNNPYPVPIIEFFADKQNIDRYVEQGDHVGLGATHMVGRKDAITLSLDYLARDPTRFVFGLGMGNVSDSQLGDGFTGAYFELFRNISVLSSGSVFLLEIGLLGTATLYLLYWLIFRDALALSRQDPGIRGSLAIGWAGVAAVFVLATFYQRIHEFESLAYLFWYFSGMVAARRMQLAAAAGAAAAPESRAAAFGPRPPPVAQQRLRT
jgi:hypothetical protein